MIDPLDTATHAIIKAIRDSWLEQPWDTVGTDERDQMYAVFRNAIAGAFAEAIEDRARLDWVILTLAMHQGVLRMPFDPDRTWREAIDAARKRLEEAVERQSKPPEGQSGG